MRKVALCRRFYHSLLLVLIKPNFLQALLDIKPEVPLVIEMSCPSRYESPLHVLRLGRNLHHCLPKELQHTVLKRLLAWVSCSD